MFNLNKSAEEKLNDAAQEAKTQSTSFLDNTKSRLSDIGQDVKNTAYQLGDKVQNKTAETKQDALNLVENLKALLAQTSDSVESEDVKNEIANRLLEWKGVVQEEVKHAVEVSRTQTEKVVRDQPLVSLAVAVGAGILIGYLVANNKDKS